ncbi:MAG: hypothetical protein FJ395_09695 [Verrucomicrobia bacterium]|nr:hypothetical protein [Verrucomicrobiota bacterium]
MKFLAGKLGWVALAAVLALGAWLRFQRLDLLEFKGDEAYATHIVQRVLHGGGWPEVGLLSSVKVMNPPLFLYLLVPLFMIHSSPVFVCCAIALLNLVAVAIAWHVGRKYYGTIAGLVAALLFAVSPWAVLYSRKIWAQDFVPLLVAGTLWALHALAFGKKPRAVFWVVLLPLLVIEVHFAGLALTAAVIGLLAWLRPKMDWRWAAAGALIAGALLIPYLRYQTAHDWADFRKAAKTVGGQTYKIPKDMIVHPQLGYAMPRRDPWWQALWILNSGGIEDILGLSTRPQLDVNRVWPPRDYFRDGWRWGDAILAAQRVALVAALAWLAIRGGPQGRLLLIMVLGPLAVFVATRLYTVQSYFVVLYPAMFLALGVAAQTIRWRAVVGVIVTIVAAANVWFMLDLYGYLSRHGGAHGGYGTVIGHKLAAAQFLRERVDLEGLMSKKQLMQMDQWGKVERARLELPVLASRMEGQGKPDIEGVLIVDMNRTDFPQPTPKQVSELLGGRSVTATNFGPMLLFLAGR